MEMGSFFSVLIGEQFQEFGSLFSAKYNTNGNLLPPNFINVVGCLYGIGDMESLCEPGKRESLHCYKLGPKQWVAEVQFLGVVDHPNLDKLEYCDVGLFA
uniref:Uncharacterized protein n=1 Tax=Solanum lycopersicum TaxID=4081 RepID=A0A3Q7J9D3_SOLLC